LLFKKCCVLERPNFGISLSKLKQEDNLNPLIWYPGFRLK